MTKRLPFGLEAMTQQTVPSFPVITFLREEPPIDGHFPGVTENGLEHTPHQHQKHDMEHYEHDHAGCWFSSNYVLEHKDEIVEADEEGDGEEVGVEEAGQLGEGGGGH